MIQKIVALFLLVLPAALKAQVTINAQVPPAGFIQKDQLWNLVMVNNGNDVLDISLQLNLQDAVTGQVVLTGTTGNIVLGKGVKVITARDIQPVSYSFTAADFTKSYVPMGTYVACYQLFNNSSRKVLLGEECIRLNVDPLSPPLLNSPADKASVETPYPQFTWMPPTPFEMFSHLSYDLLITEVKKGQSPSEAIQYNNPVYTKSDITQPFESYASSFTKLDTGKVYAWQVVAKNGLNYSGKTEVWSFTVKPPVAPKQAPAGNYLLLDDKIAGTYNVNGSVLHVRYYSFAAYTTVVRITDQKGNVLKEFGQKIVAGDNFFDWNTGGICSTGNTYRVSLADNEQVQQNIQFTIQ